MYKMHEFGPKKRESNLDELFTPKNQEIVPLEEAKAKISSKSNAIINMKQLKADLAEDGWIKVEYEVQSKKRVMKSRFKERKKDEFFKMLSKELHSLA